jgi:hypothetical protein
MAAPVQQLTGLQISISQEIFPAGHGSHGTPDPMLKRVFRFSFPEGEAQVDQTDYGHPGRMNPCYPQVIPSRLQPKTPKILAAAQALADLL